MALRKRLQFIFSIVIIVLLIISFQYQLLGIEMFGDDYAVIKSYTNKELTSAFRTDLSNTSIAWISAYRPFFPLMYHVAYKICGFDSYNLHMLIIILQILQTIVAFIFFRMLTQKDSVALVSCLLFPLNPNLWWHFTYSAEIPAIIGMIPFLLSLISLISYIRNPRRLMIFFHCLFAFLAYFTKETYAPLFFISIVTIIFYRRQNYRQYLPLVGWHMFIFISYLKIRFHYLSGKWGGQGVSPDHYSGVREYLFNYFSFISKISLFDHYITAGPFQILLYIVIICILLTALKQVLTLYREIHRKLLFVTLPVLLREANRTLLVVVLSVFLFPTYWLLTNISRLQALFQIKPFSIEGFFIVYSIGLFIIVTLILVNRKKSSYLDKQSVKVASFIEEISINQFTELSNPGQIETLAKFFSYSFIFLLLSGLPMFFFPNGRIMNVTALGMGGVFGSSFLIVFFMISKNRHKVDSLFSRKAMLRYALLSVVIMFVLNNGLMFKDEYIGPKSIYSDSGIRNSEVINYILLYPEFERYGLTEQGAYIFHKLVSRGLVDRASGKLNVETIKYLPQMEKRLRENCISESKLHTFQPSDAKIYPITNLR